MWNFFRLENEHLNNCGQFRAIKDIPLPYHIRVEGEFDVAEEEEEEEAEADVEENHDTTEPDQHKDPSSGGASSAVAVPGSTSSTPSRQLSRQHSRGHTIRSSGSTSRNSFQLPASSVRKHLSRASSSRPSSSVLSALAEGSPMLVPRSKTFVEDAMAEAGFGDHQREHLVGGLTSNKFYDRRDFDSKIVDIPEVSFTTKPKPPRSSAASAAGLTVNTMPMQSSSGTRGGQQSVRGSSLTGLGMEFPPLTNQSSGSGSAGMLSSPTAPTSSVLRRRETIGNRIKTGLFGRSKDDSDDDDSDDEEGGLRD